MAGKRHLKNWFRRRPNRSRSEPPLKLLKAYKRWRDRGGRQLEPAQIPTTKGVPITPAHIDRRPRCSRQNPIIINSDIPLIILPSDEEDDAANLVDEAYLGSDKDTSEKCIEADFVENPNTYFDPSTVKDSIINALKTFKVLKVENIVLNCNSFAQTVENIFAVSSLAHAGEVSFTVDDNGSLAICSMINMEGVNVTKSELPIISFIYNFEWGNWEKMKLEVPMGAELLPHRGLPK